MIECPYGGGPCNLACVNACGRGFDNLIECREWYRKNVEKE